MVKLRRVLFAERGTLFASKPLKIPAELQAVHACDSIAPVQSHFIPLWFRAMPFSIIIVRQSRRRTLARPQSRPTDSSSDHIPRLTPQRWASIPLAAARVYEEHRASPCSNTNG
jgi:hypothetical protein